MLDIGAGFDDDLFTETKKRTTRAAHGSYTAKICDSQWYQDEDVNDPTDMHSVHKYRGDAAFYKGHYDEALKHYDESLARIFSTNIPMWKDVQEARSRCNMHAGYEEKAMEIARLLSDQASNYDQHTTVLYLKADIYKHFHHHTDELETVLGLLTLHVGNPDLWLRLAHIYQTLEELASHQQTETSHSGVEEICEVMEQSRIGDENSPLERPSPIEVLAVNGTESSGERVGSGPPLEICGCTCLLQARCLLKNVQHTIGSFARDRNIHQISRVNKELERYDLPEDLVHTCVQFLYKHREREEETTQSDADKLEMLQKLTRTSFEKLWFSWYDQESNTR